MRLTQIVSPVIAAAALLAPAGLQAQDAQVRRDSAAAFRPVLPPDYPTYLSRYVGAWSMTFIRSDNFRAVEAYLDLVPDSVPAAAVALQLNHTCFTCMRAALSADWSRLLVLPPSSNWLQFSTDTVHVSGMIGKTMQILFAGDIRLNGHWLGDSAVGTWQQLESPDSAKGTFTLRRRGMIRH